MLCRDNSIYFSPTKKNTNYKRFKIRQGSLVDDFFSDTFDKNLWPTEQCFWTMSSKHCSVDIVRYFRILDEPWFKKMYTTTLPRVESKNSRISRRMRSPYISFSTAHFQTSNTTYLHSLVFQTQQNFPHSYLPRALTSSLAPPGYRSLPRNIPWRIPLSRDRNTRFPVVAVSVKLAPNVSALDAVHVNAERVRGVLSPSQPWRHIRNWWEPTIPACWAGNDNRYDTQTPRIHEQVNSTV